MHNWSTFTVMLLFGLILGIVGSVLTLIPRAEEQSEIALTQAIDFGAVIPDEFAQNAQQMTPTVTPTASNILTTTDISRETITLDFNLSSPSDSIGIQSDATYISEVVTVPDINPEPYLHLGTVWWVDGVLLDTSIITISIRDSIDNETWSDWQAYDHFHLLDNGDMYGHLLTFPPETAFLQFQLAWNTPDLRINATIRGVELAFISPGITANPVTQPFQQPNDNGGFVILADAQTVVSRTQWGCPDGQNSPEWQPSYTNVTHLIIHHTVSSNNITDWGANVRAIWDYHTNILDWGDIGYNYLIDPNGVIYEGRAGGDGSMAAHFSCFNSNTMGVAMLGTFSSVAPTDNALRSLERLLAWKSDTFGIAPIDGSWHNPSALWLMNISGHRDGNSSQYGCPGGTVCPGNVLYNLLPSIRSNADEIVRAVPIETPTPTATFTPTSTPTPTNTPVGYAIAQINESEFLDALQRANDNTDVRLIIVIFNDQRIQIYIEIDDVTGIVTVNPIWGLNYITLQIENMVNVDETLSLPDSFTSTVNTNLPTMMVDALDYLLAQRYEDGVDAENIIINGNMMLLGVIEP